MLCIYILYIYYIYIYIYIYVCMQVMVDLVHMILHDVKYCSLIYPTYLKVMLINPDPYTLKVSMASVSSSRGQVPLERGPKSAGPKQVAPCWSWGARWSLGPLKDVGCHGDCSGDL